MASGKDESAPKHAFTQTKTELTITVPLPSGGVARDVSCRVAGGRIDVSMKMGDELLSGELWGSVSGSVWSVESGLLNIELDKARPQFWPCALRGDPEIDVAALVAREKRDAQPAYKPPPDAGAKPQRVTDKATMRKLKAEFPQLDLPVNAQEHIISHANYAGHRSDFAWGSVDVAAAAAAAEAAPTAQPSATAADSAAGFEWGSVDAAVTAAAFEGAPPPVAQPSSAITSARSVAAAPPNAAKKERVGQAEAHALQLEATAQTLRLAAEEECRSSAAAGRGFKMTPETNAAAAAATVEARAARAEAEEAVASSASSDGSSPMYSWGALPADCPPARPPAPVPPPPRDPPAPPTPKPLPTAGGSSCQAAPASAQPSAVGEGQSAPEMYSWGALPPG